jgi:integrase
MHCGRKQSIAPRKQSRREKGTGEITKLAGNRRKPWCAKKNGVYVGTFATKAEAAIALQTLVDRPVSDYYNYTVAEMFALWKQDHFKDITQKGVEQYETAFKKLEPIHCKKFRTLHIADMQIILDDLEAQNKSESTRNKVRQLLSQLYKRAMADHIVDQNDAQFLRVRSDIKLTGKKKSRPIFTTDDIAILKAHDSDDTVRLILIMIYSGMRISELMTMRKKNVNLEIGYMIGGEKTAAGIDRLIPIHPIVSPYIYDFYDRAAGDLLISGYSGNKNPRNFREREFYPTLIRLGINRAPTGDPTVDAQIEADRLKPHAARRTFATMAVRSGIKPEHLQKIIGHAQYETTLKYYAQMSPEDLIASMLDIEDGSDS